MDRSDFIHALLCPAFLVENGLVTQANVPALQKNIEIGSQIADYIFIGSEEYQNFSQGKLCLTLKICDAQWDAYVTALECGQIFCLETEYQEPELRAFALAAQQLRDPLSSAMIGTELLQADIQENPEAVVQLAQINRSLHRILRAISNMSDASIYKTQQAQLQETVDATAIFQEFLEKASTLAEKANRKICYKIPNISIQTLADRQKLERSVLNLLSNALRYSPKDSLILAELKSAGHHLYFTVENTMLDNFISEPFSQYLREPSLGNGLSGIGLGVSIVHSVAASHGGTLLIEQTKNNTVRFTMTLAIRSSKETILRSPVLLPTDYAGGKDRTLLELSDILPDDLYADMN